MASGEKAGVAAAKRAEVEDDVADLAGAGGAEETHAEEAPRAEDALLDDDLGLGTKERAREALLDGAAKVKARMEKMGRARTERMGRMARIEAKGKAKTGKMAARMGSQAIGTALPVA